MPPSLQRLHRPLTVVDSTWRLQALLHYFLPFIVKMSSVDFTRHISLQIKSLKLFGLWFYIPYPMKSWKFWLGVLTRAILGIIMFIIPTGGQIVYLIRLVLSGKVEIQEIAGIMNLVLTEMLASCRLLDLCLRRELFRELTNQLNSKEFCFTNRNDILEKAVNISRYLFWIFLFSCSCDVAVHVLVVPGLHKFETLPLKMDLIFFDVNEAPYFKYICVYQIIYKPTMVVTYIAVQTLPWATMCFVSSQLDVLIYNFENMKGLIKATMAERQCDENEAFKEVFRGCVLHHCSIMRFLKLLQSTFGGQLTSNLFLNACIICSTSVQIFSIESPLKNITEVAWVLAYLSIFICMLFIDCYFGNTITVKCAHVPTAVISCPWLKLPKELKRNVVIFIARAQQPVIITAAMLVPVSLETFTKVMNWTYKAFAVMNQMKN
ncbi:odorant receptor 33a-like [Manduca sexta]|uniref:odorant receptor 33a-like n=1 Tax=Manduca sexta TaxID=7130 RepID=UPI00188E1D40|nr:odorant receptor 33a-like [Manduca sexta]